MSVSVEPMDIAWGLLKRQRQTTLGEFHPDFPSPHGPVTAWRSAPAKDVGGPLEPRRVHGYFRNIHPNAPDALIWAFSGPGAQEAASSISRNWSRPGGSDWSGIPRRSVGIRGSISRDYEDEDWSNESTAGWLSSGVPIQAFGTEEVIPPERLVWSPMQWDERVADPSQL